MDSEELFRKALSEESDFPLSDTLYDYILSNSTVVTVAEPICGFRVVDGKVIALDGSEVTVYTIGGIKMVNANLSKGLYVAVSANAKGIITVK